MMGPVSDEPDETLTRGALVDDDAGLTVELSQPQEVEGGPDGAVRISVTVMDVEHPMRAATFEYVSLPGHRLAPVSVSVAPAPFLPPEEYVAIWPSELRDLPLSRWESAARFRAELELGNDMARQAVQRRGRGSDAARKWVLELHPELEGDDSPAARRRLVSLTHLADIAVEYSYRSIVGVRDPAAAIARSRDAKPGTVRTWIHRARKAGFLPDSQ
jgi:hypothetical protein